MADSAVNETPSEGGTTEECETTGNIEANTDKTSEKESSIKEGSTETEGCETTSNIQANTEKTIAEKASSETSLVPESMIESSKVERKGEAKIKSQYLLVDYKPKIVSDYVPQETKDAMKRMITENGDDQPVSKKLRLKGRNKKRPFEKNPDASKKLCASISQEQECTFGDKCIFLHDINTFLASKPKDIGPKCYLFDKYGKCPYSFSCRFAQHHLTVEQTNLVNEELYEKQKDALSKRWLNNLDKDIQRLLWKRKYDFRKAEKFLKDMKDGKQTANNNGVSSIIEADSSDKTTDLARETNPESKMSDAVSKSTPQTLGCVTDEGLIALRPAEKKKIDFSNKLYLAPLTTVGNLPYRRICKSLGADITCSEMAMATSLLQGKTEWALLKRHPSEDLFGIQVCGSHYEPMTRCAQLIQDTCKVDFIDINCGCPIELVFQKGEGCALMGRSGRLEQIVRGMKSVLEIPLTLKMRTGIYGSKSIAHTLIPRLKLWGIDLVTIHGRSREQRYTKLADWDYIKQCSIAGKTIPIFGNGDVYSFEDANAFQSQSGVSGLMVARGALIKPWIFTEIKEQRHWDISSSERMDILRQFVHNGFEHWGSDQQGVETTRRFLLEWLSFLHRYIPVGILERVPQKINERPPYYFARDDLETLMASSNCGDWIKISEMLLGPVPDQFVFLPKHKANAYK